MSLGTCGGADILEGVMHFPTRGPWWSKFKLDTPTPPAGRVTIAFGLGGIAVVGTVVKSGTFLGSSFVRVVGGAAGMTALISPLAFQSPLVRDPVGAILQAAGETLSPTVSTGLLGTQLPSWSIASVHAARAMDQIAYATGVAVGQALNWRVLPDGTIWVGQETWPAQALPPTANNMVAHPIGPRYEIACETPTLLPGVNLTDVGLNVVGVDHWISSDSIRTWAWP